MKAEFARSIRNGHYEKADDGIFLPRQNIMLGGVFTHDVCRNGELLGEQSDKNLVTNAGLDYVLDVAYRNQTVSANWYIGMFESNYTPLAADTVSVLVSSYGESASTVFDESVRQAWTIVAPSSQVLTNTAAKATYTIAAAQTPTIYGAFLVDSSTIRNVSTGVLNSASKFSTARSLVATDELLITYTITASDV